MDYSRLKDNIIEVIEEQQLKLGYLKETVRLYYPLSSLNRFLGVKEGVEEMQMLLENFVLDVKDCFGKVVVTNEGERFCIAIPQEGAEYIHNHMDTDGFLCDLLAAVTRHGSTLEDVLAQFYRHSAHVRVEEIRNGEFDYLVYFENGEPDSYRYCITAEADHIIYHRYTKEDYEEFGF